jgi:hypothetical protein
MMAVVFESETPLQFDLNDTASSADFVELVQGDAVAMSQADWLQIRGSNATSQDRDVFRFLLSEPSGLFLDLDSDSFDAELTVSDMSLNVLGYNNDGYDFHNLQITDTQNNNPVASDPSLYLDLPAGTYYVEVSNSPDNGSGSYELYILADSNYTSAVPQLDSFVTAPNTLHLDFDGHASTDDARAAAVGPYSVGAFDFDGDPNTFSPAERFAIQNVWRIVAEDFSPFEINITTTEPEILQTAATNPGAANGIAERLVITDSDRSNVTDHATAIGVSMRNTFASDRTAGVEDNLAFTFSGHVSDKYAPTSSTAEQLFVWEMIVAPVAHANVTSHEFGHALGLDHYPTTATNSSIMGGPIQGIRRRTWATGLDDDTPSPQFQDDIAIISGFNLASPAADNTINFRPDDHGNLITSATQLGSVIDHSRASGVIEQFTDLDLYEFTVPTPGMVAASVDVDEFKNNLDASLRVLDSNGAAVSPLTNFPPHFDPSDSQYDAVAVVSLVPGTYYLEISSDGDDGELGQYDVEVTPLCSADAVPNVIYVSNTAFGANDGTSWHNAYHNLEVALSDPLAVNASANGTDVDIWVRHGMYTPGPDRTDTFQLRSNVSLLGGFSGCETNRDQRDWIENQTILNGDIERNDIIEQVATKDGVGQNVAPGNEENVYHVVTGADHATLDGFYVERGNASNEFLPDMGGGGMFNDHVSPYVTNVVFRSNHADYGGGMLNTGENVKLYNVVFERNHAELGGGLASIAGTRTGIINGVFFANSAAGVGGAAYNIDVPKPPPGKESDNTQLLLMNSTLIDNQAPQGAGVANLFGGQTSLINSIIFSAPAHPNQGSLFNDDLSSSTLRHSNIEGLSAVTTQAGVTNVGGNIDTDPGFANPYGFIDGDGPDNRWANFDDGLAPKPSSPVVDAGTVLTFPPTPDEDIRGVQRPSLSLQPNSGIPPTPSPWANTQIDMGAYEARRIRHFDAAAYTIWRDHLGQTGNHPADSDESGVVDQNDYTIWRNNFGKEVARTTDTNSVPNHTLLPETSSADNSTPEVTTPATGKTTTANSELSPIHEIASGPFTTLAEPSAEDIKATTTIATASEIPITVVNHENPIDQPDTSPVPGLPVGAPSSNATSRLPGTEADQLNAGGNRANLTSHEKELLLEYAQQLALQAALPGDDDELELLSRELDGKRDTATDAAFELLEQRRNRTRLPVLSTADKTAPF